MTQVHRVCRRLTRIHQAAHKYVQDHTTKSFTLCKIVMKTMLLKRHRGHSRSHNLASNKKWTTRLGNFQSVNRGEESRC